MTAAPSVLVFDVNETLIDIESMARFSSASSAILGECGVVRPTGHVLDDGDPVGHYVDFFTLGQGLADVATIRSVEITETDVGCV